MANYFVDSTTGDNGDNGTTMDLAWATIEYAVVSGGLSPGDIVWVRRVHSETLTAQVNMSYDGRPGNPMRIIGWPRNSESSITSATWTNGSTTVDLVVGLTMDREKHVGRFITAPDGFDYLITYITDSNTFIIDREYVGSSVSGASGACTIKADEDYALAQAIDDSGWTINVAAWTADADDMPLIDGNTNNIKFYSSDDCYHIWKNLHLTCGNNTIFHYSAAGVLGLFGCLVETGTQSAVYCTNTSLIADRLIMDGESYSSGASGYALQLYYSMSHVRNSAIYGQTDSPLVLNCGVMYLENVNINVEYDQLNANVIYQVGGNTKIHGRDVKINLSGNEVLDLLGRPNGTHVLSVENYQKVLGEHISLGPQGTITKTAVVAGSGDPYKRAGGNDSVLEILFDKSESLNNWSAPCDEFVEIDPLFSHEFEAPSTDRRKYRYYVQAEGAVAATELWIECEYVSAYDDTSEYVIKKVTSDEAITARTGADDWSQYIEVTGISPAVGSKIRIRCYCSYYHATNKIYIDPLPEVTT